VTDAETAVAQPPDINELRREVEGHSLWYHTIELAPGLVTPGWFDLRPIVDAMPWPDVRGKRCLDVGTYDGFLAFELERRGAAEVVATDIGDPSGWDLSVGARARGQATIAQLAGEKTGGGFAIAKRALKSSVQRVEISIYDLTPESLGVFDVVVCGSLLLHLKDPVRGVERIREVCGETFLSAETIRLGLGLTHRRRALAELRGGVNGQWWVPTASGHRMLLTSAGFMVEHTVKPYSIPFGEGHPGRQRNLTQRAFTHVLTGRAGVPHSAVIARPD
jgi:tRNA (mo5U34)-methyltransferase